MYQVKVSEFHKVDKLAAANIDGALTGIYLWSRLDINHRAAPHFLQIEVSICNKELYKYSSINPSRSVIISTNIGDIFLLFLRIRKQY